VSKQLHAVSLLAIAASAHWVYISMCLFYYDPDCRINVITIEYRLTELQGLFELLFKLYLILIFSLRLMEQGFRRKDL